MILRNATAEDVVQVSQDSMSRGCLDRQPEVVDFVYALEHEGVVLGIGGVKLLNPHTAWCWFDLSRAARKHIVAVFRRIRDQLDALSRVHGIGRMMAAVDASFPEAIRTARHLGFEQESVLKDFFGKGKDGLLFVWLKE